MIRLTMESCLNGRYWRADKGHANDDDDEE